MGRIGFGADERLNVGFADEAADIVIKAVM
ncbi:hypothetical protein M529_17905 [Sphingobium ummariense RL-3]|uniref:Uncharacterized protein n=1 Tax=Sphingobium ummariense RL-3 TaxID=1346791 RepID=T0KBH9_9SPHN|nr:hypothetical protein M529_17905 [Sphingobium ummariense RL-3]